MAKTFYIPVNGQSKKPKKWYVPVNGLSKEAKKAYCPVNLLSKLFWGDESGEGIEEPVMVRSDYNLNQSYPATRASIEDTVRFALEKMVFINRYCNSPNVISTLENNIEDIVSYVSGQASSYNQCFIKVQAVNSSKINMNVFLGNSSVTSVTPTNYYGNFQFYPWYFASQPTDNCSCYCQIEINANGTVNKNTYTYTGQNINIALGLLSISKGTYDRTMDFISQMGNFCVSFTKKKTKVLADWDFTVSNRDKIDDMTAQSDAYASLTPVPFTDIVGGIKVPPWPLKYANVFEVGIGTITDLNTSNAFSIVNAVTFGFTYQSDGNTFSWQVWSSYAGQTAVQEPIGVSDPYAFENSVVKLKIDDDGHPSVYKDNVLIYKCTHVELRRDKVYGDLMIVLGDQQCKCTITHLKIYIE